MRPEFCHPIRFDDPPDPTSSERDGNTRALDLAITTLTWAADRAGAKLPDWARDDVAGAIRQLGRLLRREGASG
ncbi:MAG: hypothetical protein JKY65_05485 [Planctomycetes bacterium]|nr:hypothetical protein [Planctomycetota bacterium]